MRDTFFFLSQLLTGYFKIGTGTTKFFFFRGKKTLPHKKSFFFFDFPLYLFFFFLIYPNPTLLQINKIMSSTLFNDIRQQNTYVQPLLHEPPVVYGNLPQYYQQQQQQQHIMQYPPHNVVYGPPSQIYYNQNEMMIKSSSIHSSNNSPRTPRLHSSSPRLVTPLTPPPSTEDRVKETIARANAIPAEFYQTEFLEYSKKSYDGRKRKRTESQPEDCKKPNLQDTTSDPTEE